MKDLSGTDVIVDDIATLLDAALADPARAAFVRVAMRQRLAESGASGPHLVAEDADDMWDNVPV